jgi:hypothetical protein
LELILDSPEASAEKSAVLMFYILSKDPHKAFSAGCKFIPGWQEGSFSAIPLLIDIVL